jgi:hypothetical protein
VAGAPEPLAEKKAELSWAPLIKCTGSGVRQRRILYIAVVTTINTIRQKLQTIYQWHETNRSDTRERKWFLIMVEGRKDY